MHAFTYNHLSLKKTGNGFLHAGALHLLLHVVEEHPKKLLHVVLLKGVVSLPAKRLCQFFRVHWLIAKLQVVKDVLQGESDACRLVVTFRGHLVHRFSQFVGEKERLQEGVHVAGGALVLQSHTTGVLLRVPAPAVRNVRLHRRLEDELVIL
mgnify:CR=1 FL=1